MTSVRTADVGPSGDTFPLEGGPSGSLLVGIGIALVVEGVALHLWIAPRSQRWAWAITVINAATLVWLWHEHRARATAALTLGARDVQVVMGNQLQARFPRSAVATADLATWRSVPDAQSARDYVNSAKPLEPNVLIVFREPVAVRLPLGIGKRVTRLGVRVADPARLVSSLAVQKETHDG